MVVEVIIEVPTSRQCTTVPFKSLLTELITSVEINGELPWAEVLIKVKDVEFTAITDIC